MQSPSLLILVPKLLFSGFLIMYRNMVTNQNFKKKFQVTIRVIENDNAWHGNNEYIL